MRLAVLEVRVREYEVGAARREVEEGGGSPIRLLGGVVVAASTADPADFLYDIPLPVFPFAAPGLTGGLPGALAVRATPSIFGTAVDVSEMLRDPTRLFKATKPLLPADGLGRAEKETLAEGAPEFGTGGVGDADVGMPMPPPPLNVLLRLTGRVPKGCGILLLTLAGANGMVPLLLLLPVLPDRPREKALGGAGDAGVAILLVLFESNIPEWGRPVFFGVVGLVGFRLGELGSAKVPARGLKRPPAWTTTGKVRGCSPRGVGFRSPSGFLSAGVAGTAGVGGTVVPVEEVEGCEGPVGRPLVG